MEKPPPNNLERASEVFPSTESVRSVFEQILEGEEYKEIRRREDKRGLYLWDIACGENEDTEYSYMRAGQYPEGQASITAIHVTFFDEEGDPIGGHSVAKYIDGEWKITP